jgi:serine/threonine protein kinase, bacterial
MRPGWWLLYLLRRLFARREAIPVPALALVTVVLTAIAGCGSSQKSAPSSPSSPSSVSPPSSARPQVQLPFTGLNKPGDVAVNTAGDLYVADYGNSRVLRLAAGSSFPMALPFTGLNKPQGVAVDTAGNLYVTDEGNDRVLKLPAG